MGQSEDDEVLVLSEELEELDDAESDVPESDVPEADPVLDPDDEPDEPWSFL